MLAEPNRERVRAHGAQDAVQGAGGHVRRTNAAKRAAVVAALSHPDTAAWSNRAIAARCQVGPSLVNDVRGSLPESVAHRGRTYITKHGTLATMRVSRIGCRRPPKGGAPTMAENPTTTAQNRNPAPAASDQRRDPRWWVAMLNAGLAPTMLARETALNENDNP